jgi:formate C-acetyltransferase
MRSIEELIDATIENYKHLVKRLVLASKIADKLYEEYVPRPFLSAVLDDSIERAQDVREWNYGPEYRDIVVLGLNNTADSLAAIKKLVFEEKKISMEELIRALENNWEGYEDLRRMCLNAPKFGNDDDYVDLISSSLARRVSEETEKFKTDFGNSLIVDGTVASAFWLWGRLSGPTADGRKRGDTFHDGSISPIGGNDRNGPTAVLKSASKVDPLTTWNHLLNQSFIDQYLKGHDAELFAQYLKTWADLGIHHIQFSVVDRETLIDAQRNPSQYSNLMVRVCGYSAYFVDLAEDLQNSIIARTPQCLKA